MTREHKGEEPKVKEVKYQATFAEEIGDLEGNGFRITSVTDISPWLNGLTPLDSAEPELLQEVASVKKDIRSIVMLDIEPTDVEDANPMLHGRRATLLETKNGDKAIVVVVRHGGGSWGNFGGAGVYNHGGPSRLAAAVEHSQKLATIMTTKAYAIGVEDQLGGSKTVIDSADWLSNPSLQFATGALFSPEGPFPNVITGSDAGQTAETIDSMYRGSMVAGAKGGEIVGTKDGLPDTASYCYWTMLKTYETLQGLYPEENLPSLQGIDASVQGIGKIGTATVEMLLDSGAKTITLTDIVLFDDTLIEYAENQGLWSETAGNIQSAMNAKVEAWQERAASNGQKVKVVRPEAIYDQPASLYAPCATVEGDIDNDKVNRLAESGVRVILSGANGPMASLETVKHAERKGILTPHETVANGGSATSAALEALRYLPEQDEWQGDSRRFVEEVLVPHVDKNVRAKLASAQKYAGENGSTLYEGTTIDVDKWLETIAN